MKIGIDLDGVVYDTETMLRAKAELFDLKMSGKGLVSQSSWSVKKRHGWTDEVISDFENDRLNTTKSAPVIPLAREVLNMLSKEGHTLVAITTRGEICEKEKVYTRKVLKRDKIKFDKIIYTQTGKLKACLENKIDIMIDDKPETIKELAKNKIRCFYFRSAELPKIKNDYVTMVYNWGQIYRIIKEIEGGKK